MEREENLGWRLFFAPFVSFILRRYVPRVSASITICQPIAERYAQEYGFKPIVVLNAPRPVSVPDHETIPITYTSCIKEILSVSATLRC